MKTTAERERIEKRAYDEQMASTKKHYEDKGQPMTESALHKEVSGIQEKVAREKKHQIYKD